MTFGVEHLANESPFGLNEAEDFLLPIDVELGHLNKLLFL